MHYLCETSQSFCHSVPFCILNSAAAAARRVYAPAAWVPVKYSRAVFTVENNPRVPWLFKPGAARYRVKFNIIARVYPGAGPAAVARIFCAHAFNCHFVTLA
jgi:hypothetical protein